MKKITIIKTGGTFPELASRKGDFEHWTLAGMDIVAQNAQIADVTRREALPDYEQIAGIVITGSHAMVTEGHEWSEGLAAWLPEAVEREIPILGICYGHQLLAQALGGEAGNNPNGKEFGTVEIQLNAEAENDPLLGHLSKPFQAQVCHTQSALRLPPGATLLASSVMEPHQAFRVGKCAWGVQFHPEFDAEATRHYITTYQQELCQQGADPQSLLQNCRETPESSGLLKRFAQITLN